LTVTLNLFQGLIIERVLGMLDARYSILDIR
jgi:hypothetical protein